MASDALSDDPAILSNQFLDILRQIAAFGDLRINFFRKEFRVLTRRTTMFIPFFEELQELKQPLNQNTRTCFLEWESALRSVKRLLNSIHNGSRLFLVFAKDKFEKKFQRVAIKLDKALKIIPFDSLDISEEVKDQVRFVHVQIRKTRAELPSLDWDLYADIGYLSETVYKEIDPAAFKRVVEKLELKTVIDLKHESEALFMMVTDNREGDEDLEKVSEVLRKIKEYVLTEYSAAAHVFDDEMAEESPSCQIPNDYKCPITLELMEDPVIVSTGQTYDRVAITQWLSSGHNTCPKTGTMLTSFQLTPNVVLRSLIVEWCEKNGVEFPKKKPPENAMTRSFSNKHGNDDSSTIDALFWKITCGPPSEHRDTASKLRTLAKKSHENRMYMYEKGIIMPLIELLCSHDDKVQEHAVTALFNLTISECLRAEIGQAGPIPRIIEVVKSGNINARANAAGTLFNLVSCPENRVKLAQDGGIPPLVKLLSEGDETGKRDAAGVLYRLCKHAYMKSMAIRAGIVKPLMDMARGSDTKMQESALLILAVVATEEAGKVSIWGAGGIPFLVRQLKSGTPKAKEYSVSALLELCSYSPEYLREACRLHIREAILPLLDSAHERTQRKATFLLEHIDKFAHEC